MLKIGVIGARVRNSNDDYIKLKKVIEFYIEKYGKENITLVSGGCKEGGDYFAEVINHTLQLNPMIIHYPDKTKLPRNPTKKDFAIINYARNTLIARDSDILIALVKPERKGGTEDTIKKFEGYSNKKAILL